MIIEVRTYHVKPGQRDRFLEFFHRHAVPLQQSCGMRVMGPFVDLEDADVFHWLRAFPSLEARDRLKDALYEGPAWKNELEAIAMPMLARYTSALTTTLPGFVNDLTDLQPATGG
ncbi:MAG TPA: NIPSNAP family protein [Longimicrobium sp.]|nr:NIPSNAP family protein [Longimicrobium sp.]